jgi:hypothetical protein
LFTVPPSEAVTDKVYFTIGVGASGIGLSLEQDKRIKKINRVSLLINNRSLLKYIEYIINEVNAF